MGKKRKAIRAMKYRDHLTKNKKNGYINALIKRKES